jgi:hypothetical protein
MKSPIKSCSAFVPRSDCRGVRLGCHIARMAILRFHVVPYAKQNKMMGEHGVTIKIKLHAPALEGKANTALRAFLAEE